MALSFLDSRDYQIDMISHPKIEGVSGENILIKNVISQPGVVAHAFDPSTREAEAGGFLSSRPAWSTK
jgi:major histocompatibility complex class I